MARKPSDTLSLAGAVGAVVAAACCAGLPAAAALLGGLGTLTLIGGSAGLLLTGAVLAFAVALWRARRRRRAADRGMAR